MNVSVNATPLWITEQAASQYYMFQITNNTGEEGAFNEGGSTETWTQLPMTGNTIAIAELNWSDDKDTARIDILVEVPPTEPAGNKTSNVTFTSRLAE
jgi:hypothetical protein